jgi:hypothetical protein
MKKYLYAPLLAAGAALILAACEDEELMPLPPPPPPPMGTRYEDTPPPSTTTTTETTTTRESAPPPPPPVEASGPLQVGKPVPGRAGFVTSPHSSDPNAIIDVRGMPPGMEVQDPYTKKNFLVP